MRENHMFKVSLINKVENPHNGLLASMVDEGGGFMLHDAWVPLVQPINSYGHFPKMNISCPGTPGATYK